MNRALDVETCCEEINVKSFVKLQFCLEEVREIERTRLEVYYLTTSEAVVRYYVKFNGNWC